MRYLIGLLWLRVFGWRAEAPAELPRKFVFICAPHTSNWDLPFMLGVAWTLGLRVSWIGKHTLFRGPLGWVMRALGGIPIDRRAPQGMVASVAEHFGACDELRLGIPPEGTRSRVEQWRSGFYHIARAADVPVALGFLDFARRVGGIGGFIALTGDVTADMDRVRAFYRDVRGRFPSLESPPRLKEEEEEEEEEAAAVAPRR